jgi:hypothetical protein
MKPRIFPTLLIVLALAGCGTFEVSIEQPAGATSTPGAVKPVETSANEAPSQPVPTIAVNSASQTPSPPTPVPDIAIVNTPDAAQGPIMVQIFLIALEDQGGSGKLIGCGDSAVAVQVQIPPTQGVLRAALDALLLLRTQYYGQSGLYNALYQSDLHVESVVIQNGEAVVKLAGNLTQGGECDSPRIEAQLEETVLQFSTVSKASIFINGRPLADVLSLRGN